MAKALAGASVPTDKVTLGVDALLVRQPGRNVLIDTGLGPKVGGALIASLAKTGLTPEAINDVLITHSHGDHIGGLLTRTGALAFPRASIHMSQLEWAWMKKKGDKALVAAITPRVRTFRSGAAVMPDIVAVGIPGHTPGHVGYRIGSGNDRLFDIGDFVYTIPLG